jgi:chitinase
MRHRAPAVALLFLLALAANAQRVNIAYFYNGGTAYHPKNIATSGAAARITHLMYAFGKPTATGCAISDPVADYEKPYGAADSVDGKADRAEPQTVRGNFGQLLKLKAAYPRLKVLISLGGWTLSSHFSEAASSAASRQAFAASCIGLFIKGDLGNGMSMAGLFDGIDVDWEYPGALGNTSAFSPADPRNFTLLLAEFRRQLDLLGKRHLLTIAAPAGHEDYSLLDLNAIHPYLNYINLMAYDFHGTWEKVTNHHAALYANPAEPADTANRNIDRAVTDYLAAGVPPAKLVLGVPFYGHGWKGVPNTNNGLFQPGSGPAKSSDEPGSESGTEAFRALKNLGYPAFRDPVAQAFWVYSPSAGIFWSYDDPASLLNKTNYIKRKGLAGAMSWELSNDDSAATLLTTLANGLQ